MEHSYNYLGASLGSKHAYESPAVGSQDTMHNPPYYYANPVTPSASLEFSEFWETPDRRFLQPNLVRALKIGSKNGRARLKNFRVLLTVGITRQFNAWLSSSKAKLKFSPRS